jgi:RHS repeat-associated protein
VTYTYDGDGRRVEKSNGKLYWYGTDGNVLDETDATGSMTNSAFNEYIYFAGKKIARRDATGNVFYYRQDMLGSSVAMVEKAAGQTTAAVCYDADFYPYGSESNVTNTCPQNYKWTGKERDAETGNDDFDARYYSSVYGRFLSADWSAVPEAVPYANLTNPQTLNLYAIVRDNPESFADLDGHEAVLGPVACGAEGCGTNTNAATQEQKTVQQQNQTAQQQNQSTTVSQQEQAQNAATGAVVGGVVGGIIGGVVGGTAGGAIGTFAEPGGGTVGGVILGGSEGAKDRAAAGAAVGAAAGIMYTQSKDALDKIKPKIATAIEHLTSPNKLGGPDQDPRGGWKTTVRRNADQIDKLADKVANKNLANAARFTAQLLRGLAE